MKIEIRDLLPNPFRNLAEYPISTAKVAGLVSSIKSTSFWDNILVRPSPSCRDKYEIAYGHHRLKALHKIYGEGSPDTVDLPVRKLDDATMLRVMANENATDWAMDTRVIVETVKAARKFLRENPTASGKSAGRHIGCQDITEFLGGVYKSWMVEDALSIVNAIERKEVDEKAVKTITQPLKAASFVAAVRNSKEPIPPRVQRDLAKLVREDKVPVNEIRNRFAMKGYTRAYIEKPLPDIATFLAQHRKDVDRVNDYAWELIKVKSELGGLEWQLFQDTCRKLLLTLRRLLDEPQSTRRKDHAQESNRKISRISSRT